MRFAGLALLALAGVGCGGLRFADPPAGEPFRPSEVVDALAFGAIPPLLEPRHVAVSTVNPADPEPLVVIAVEGTVRAYPLSILVWHETVNDTVEDVPVVVTYSPLTDSATAWIRRTPAGEITFAPSGKIFAATGLITDRETGSLWHPAIGRAVAGPSKGTDLTAVPVMLVPASLYKEVYPSGTVVSPDTGFTRPYGRSPYRSYAGLRMPPKRLFLRSPDTTVPPMSLVLGVPGSRVYPFETVRKAGVINDLGLVIVWIAGVASALDAEIIADSVDSGSAIAFRSDAGNRSLTFERLDRTRLRDRQTGTTWNMLGRAIDGPLKGTMLQPVAGVRSLWFSWAALHPGARIYASPSAG